jgi:hypothetical protein
VSFLAGIFTGTAVASVGWYIAFRWLLKESDAQRARMAVLHEEYEQLMARLKSRQ